MSNACHPERSEGSRTRNARDPSSLTLLGMTALLLLGSTLSAQSAPTPQPTPSVSASGAIATYTLSPEKREKAISYARARYTLHFVSFFWSVIVLVAIIAFRLAPRF